MNRLKPFKDLKLIYNVVIGKYDFLENGVNVEFDIEDSYTQIEDFTEMISDSEKWIRKFSNETLGELKSKISKDLIDSAYTDSNYQPVEKDYKNLEKQMKLTEIRFLPDTVISLVFKAKKEYPDKEIYCQISEKFEIEDLFVD
jgi:hypothetical protein